MYVQLAHSWKIKSDSVAGTDIVSECSVWKMFMYTGGEFTKYRKHNTAYLTEFGKKGTKAETANNMQIISKSMGRIGQNHSMNK